MSISLRGTQLALSLNRLKIGDGSRAISSSAVLLGKRNFRKFHLGNKRGHRIFRKMRNEGAFPDITVETAVRPTGFKYGEVFHIVPEMVPEFIVPDLTDFQLKPYVSYRAGDTYQEPFQAEELFQHVYLNKLDRDFVEGKLDEEGNPLNPSEEEALTADEAWIKARMTGCDIFSERIPRQWECLDIDIEEFRKKRAAKYGYEHYADFMKDPYPPPEERQKSKEISPPSLDISDNIKIS